MNEHPEYIIWDASALILLERPEPRWAARAWEIRRGRARAVIPAPVLAEVWRGRPDQANLARFLKLPGVLVDAPDEAAARTAGELLYRARQRERRAKIWPSVVDALVAECALRYDAAAVITADTGDLSCFDLPVLLITA